MNHMAQLRHQDIDRVSENQLVIQLAEVAAGMADGLLDTQNKPMGVTVVLVEAVAQDISVKLENRLSIHILINVLQDMKIFL